MNRLVALPYSPWSEKARWALDHHHIPYRETEHVPLLGEPLLRLFARKATGKVTVPVLVAGGVVLHDSYDIARWAEEHGSGTSLFPKDADREIGRWNDRSNELMAAGRHFVLRAVAADTEAQKESMPAMIPRFLRGAMTPTAAMATSYLAKKHGTGDGADAEREATMRTVLDELDRATSGGKHTILDAFSYADIAMAAALQFVRPVSTDYIAIGPAIARAWTRENLATAFPQTLAWRDRMYGEHRRARQEGGGKSREDAAGVDGASAPSN
jgi:glutathione S-transferase